MSEDKLEAVLAGQCKQLEYIVKTMDEIKNGSIRQWGEIDKIKEAQGKAEGNIKGLWSLLLIALSGIVASFFKN